MHSVYKQPYSATQQILHKFTRAVIDFTKPNNTRAEAKVQSFAWHLPDSLTISDAGVAAVQMVWRTVVRVLHYVCVEIRCVRLCLLYPVAPVCRWSTVLGVREGYSVVGA